MITNDEKAEMVDEGQVEFPNDGLDEVVGEKLAIRSQTGLGSLHYQPVVGCVGLENRV